MLPSQKALFTLPAGAHYLNGAYMSPLLRSAEAAAADGLRQRRDPSAIGVDDFFRDAGRVRSLVARLVGDADLADRVALVPAVSYAMATVAQNLHVERGHRIVVLADQFPSHVYPWRRMATDVGAEVVAVEPPGPLGARDRGRLWNERLL
ncbi:MAG: aminotransferase, partial [Bacteroidota bacterium]